jgi:outer membrane protein TolC
MVVSGPLILDLQACLKLAQERQPRIAAHRVSLAAAQDGANALENLHVPKVLAPELPIRRRQAALGLRAASAAIEQAEQQTHYAVTRTYYAVLFARAQESVARSVVTNLDAVRKVAQLQLDAGARDVTDVDVQRTVVYLRLAEAKRIQAAQGVKRALAALKEAIGLGPDCCLNVPEGPLPEPKGHLCKADVVVAALSRRGELVQAHAFAELTGLEIEAQATKAALRMETFAAGADIHVQQVPQGIANTEYRPGAVAPEMPVFLIGNKCDRVKHAESLHARAQTVIEVTRNLLALEAENAFYRWEEASGQLVPAREAAETGEKMANSLQKDLAAIKVKVESVLNARVLAAQARSQYNEYLYNHILALADLERVTAGTFCAGLVGAVVPRAPVGSAKKTP